MKLRQMALQTLREAETVGEADRRQATASAPPWQRWPVEDARKSLARLVAEAADGHCAVIAKGASAALLAPVEHLGPDWLLTIEGWPTTPVSAARAKLGAFIEEAAQGVGQVLARRGTPVAVLLPLSAAHPPREQHPQGNDVVDASAPATPDEPGTAPSPPTPAPEPATAPSAAPQTTSPRPTPRRLVGLGEFLTPPAPETPTVVLSTGLPSLDAAGAALLPGRLVLVAAAPGAGGSLLAVGAARATALAGGHRVLYAATGLSRADVDARITAAETGVDYRALRAATLSAADRAAVEAHAERLASAQLLIDDGADLTPQLIDATARDIPDLALIIVDRLQATADPRVPLSGDAVPDAARLLAHTARDLGIPVLAVLDTDDPAMLGRLDPDVTLTLTRDGDTAQAAVGERDFGTLATVRLRADFARARFTETAPEATPDPTASSSDTATTRAAPHAAPVPGPETTTAGRTTTEATSAAEAELAAAGEPFTTGACTGLSPRIVQALSDLRDALEGGHEAALPAVRAQLAEIAAKRPRLPQTAEGHRLAAALAAYAATQPPAAAPQSPPAPGAATAAAAGGPGPDRAPQPAAAPTHRPRRGEAEQERSAGESAGGTGRDQTFLHSMITTAVEHALEDAGGDIEEATAALVKKAIPNAMALFNASRVGGTYAHTVYPQTQDFLHKKGQKKTDEVWEGRHQWRNPEFVDAIKKGTVPATDVDVLDMNAAFANAFKCHLPIGKLEHDPHGGFDRKRSGIYLLTPPAWEHPHLPNPIGARVEPGPLLLDDATVRLLIRCHQLGLCEAPRIDECWTSGASESLLEKFRRVLLQARADAIHAGDKVTEDYVKAMYSKFTSTIGESSSNRDLRRPDWMHIIRSRAFANLWLKAHKAHSAGLTIVQLSGTDELHVAGGVDWRSVFKEGRMVDEVKLKRTYRVGSAS